MPKPNDIIDKMECRKLKIESKVSFNFQSKNELGSYERQFIT